MITTDNMKAILTIHRTKYAITGYTDAVLPGLENYRARIRSRLSDSSEVIEKTALPLVKTRAINHYFILDKELSAVGEIHLLQSRDNIHFPAIITLQSSEH